ncbi:MAG: type II secretion system protein N [Betaproteobacteria bacterium]
MTRAAAPTRRSALGLDARRPRGAPGLAVAGVQLGALLALLVWPPAAWRARAAAGASGERLLLADARGTLWSGSAVLVLAGGPGSRDAAALPGRLHWTLGLDGLALAVTLRQDCCTGRTLALRVDGGLGRLRVALPPPADAEAALGQWPMQALAGLGTPWNTLAPRGTMTLASPGFAAESVKGRWRFSGRLEVALRGAGSRLTTLPVLGDYRLTVQSRDDGGATLALATDQGALQLSGQGEWAPRLRFRGQASAVPEAVAALDNLLHIIGRLQGAVSLISIG